MAVFIICRRSLVDGQPRRCECLPHLTVRELPVEVRAGGRSVPEKVPSSGLEVDGPSNTCV